ncbi:MAG: galactokinase [Neisseriaceae bacterium]
MSFSIEQLQHNFNNIFGLPQNLRYFFSPGRVNLIGEHIDYNGGSVLPCPINLGTFAVASIRNDTNFSIYSNNFPETGIIEFEINQIVFEKEHHWANYPKAVIQSLIEYGFVIPNGLDIYYLGNIPHGTGLSSSASIEVLTAVILKIYFNLSIGNPQLAKICQNAENKFIGVSCGIMDQFACVMGKKAHAILLNCNNLNFEYTNLNLKDYQIVIANTNKKRELSNSEYNNRRHECNKALTELQKVLNINDLCDLDMDTFNQYSHLITNQKSYNRALHAVSENLRTKNAVSALNSNNLESFCKLLKESHISLRENYEVTGLELDTIVEAAWKFPACVGARMTGAGFGGCTINIVQKDAIDDFTKFLSKEYTRKTNITPTFYTVTADDGCKEIFK